MATFEQALAITLGNEGGYQNSANDRGNYNSLNQLVGTNYGISAPTYENYIHRVPSVADMKGITRAIASEIYELFYWNPSNFASVNDQGIANQLFDISVLQGAGKMASIVQAALNAIGYKVAQDGAFGPATRAAINLAISQARRLDLNNQIASIRESGLGSSAWPGWVTRAESYLLDAKKKIRSIFH